MKPEDDADMPMPGPARSTAPASSPVVLVLASGRGERFAAPGGAAHKLRALLHAQPPPQHTPPPPPHRPPDPRRAAGRARGLPWHVEDGAPPGMGDSIAAAVRAPAGAPGWLVLPGDLPLIRPDTLRSIASALSGCAVAVPVHRQERGHPVGF